jgi:hypothetical protein
MKCLVVCVDEDVVQKVPYGGGLVPGWLMPVAYADDNKQRSTLPVV